MPSAWRVHAIEQYLRSLGSEIPVDEQDIYALSGDDRHVALDAIVTEGAAFPMVLVGGEVACHSGIDLDLIGALAERLR